MSKLNFQFIKIEDATIGIVETSHVSLNEIDIDQLSHSDKESFIKIRNDRRKKEWLISRMLLSKILNHYPQINYLDSGKPILDNNSHHISITHSKNHIAIMVSKEKEVALDMEDTNRKISHLESRFINNEEQVNNNLDYFKIWCAKEAIFKLLDHPNIELKTETTTDLKNETITFKRTSETFKLNFITKNNDLLCYIIR
ncbi:hypothetical protein K5X82_16520 [Halosquirtibacter xylanolyticus]|uniref:4'-phosphopantetheinyl transferase family protein n=1 Tax=Halosquirtibacter xylanolyticus TaxID=3374599 RepID=UPI003749F1BB|nr:hypothetical protein K5X82_16520 [Prolixibacteraceae bacterium]